MAARRTSNLRPGVFLLALAIALFLWGVAQGSSPRDIGFEMPIEIRGIKDSLVVTDQSAAEVSVRVRGSRAALRNLNQDRLKYAIDVSNVKPGLAEFDVELSQVPLPRGARFVGHSPSSVQIRVEDKTRKSASVRADIQGVPADGYELTEWRVVPDKVWLEGARSHVMRVAEVMTEPIDVTGLTQSETREVRLILGSGTVWREEASPVTVQLTIEPRQPVEPATEGAPEAAPSAPGAPAEARTSG